MFNRPSLRAALQSIDVTKVTTLYSGSGDEGYIDEVAGDKPIGDDLRRVLFNFFWDVISSTQWNGFHNGDGGFGEIVWDITTDRITLSHNAYVQDTITYPEETL